MLGLGVLIVIDINFAAVTVTTADPLTPLRLAEIVDVPVATPATSPLALIVATVCWAEVHVTSLVKTFVELSENLPTAMNCVVSPLATLADVDVTAIDIN